MRTVHDFMQQIKDSFADFGTFPFECSGVWYFCPMSSVRLEKVSALLKRELSTLFQQNMHIMFEGMMITVTQVRVSPDLGVARAYLSFFPTDKKQRGMELAQEKKGHLRKLLADQVGKQLRKIPELSFFVDDSLDYFEEIDRLLKKG
jgi:ribosome-binding factor A